MFHKLFLAKRMTNVEKFLRANGLKQVDLVNYLGIKPGSVSRVVAGKNNFSEENLAKLLANDKGWDTSMLTAPGVHVITNNYQSSKGNNSPVTYAAGADPEVAVLKARIEMLEQQLEEEKDRNRRYWELIQTLTSKHNG